LFHFLRLIFVEPPKKHTAQGPLSWKNGFFRGN